MNTRSKLPKVLVFGHAINPKSGTGVTLHNLFYGWEPDRIATVSDHANGGSPWAEQIRSYLLTTKEKKLGKLLVGFRGNHAHFRILNSNNTKSLRRPRRLLKLFKEFLGLDPIIHKYNLSADLLEWIQNFQPDIIYSALGDIIMTDFFLNLITNYKVPYVIQFNDDWPKNEVERFGLIRFHRRSFEKKLSIVIKNSAGLMSIGDNMSEALKSRYGREFIPFQNPADLSKFQNNRQTKNDDKAFCILYAGKVNHLNIDSLEDFCIAVSELVKEGLNLRFNIQCGTLPNEFKKRFENKLGVGLSDFVDYDKVPDTLVNSDLLIIPIGFGRRSRLKYRFSIFTKAAEYMASGSPIIVYGPNEIAMVNYAEKNQWAYVVKQRSIFLLKEAIRLIKNDATTREKIISNAKKVVTANHSSQAVRNSFRNYLIKCSFNKSNNLTWHSILI